MTSDHSLGIGLELKIAVKVALLSHLASESAPTGAEHSLSLLARGLNGGGHEVVVTAPGPWVLAADLAAQGIGVEEIPVRVCWLVQYDRQPLWRQVARAVRYALPDPGARDLRRWIEMQGPMWSTSTVFPTSVVRPRRGLGCRWSGTCARSCRRAVAAGGLPVVCGGTRRALLPSARRWPSGFEVRGLVIASRWSTTESRPPPRCRIGRSPAKGSGFRSTRAWSGCSASWWSTRGPSISCGLRISRVLRTRTCGF